MVIRKISTLIALASALLAFWTVPAHAQATTPVSNVTQREESGLTFFRDTTFTNKRVHVLKINLTDPQLKLRASTSGERGLTPSEFSAKAGALAVINGDFFDGNLKPVGLAAGLGEKWPQVADTKEWSFLACDASNNCVIDEFQRVTPWRGEWTSVVGGWQILLDPEFEWTGTEDKECGEFCTTEHPRTAVGLSEDRTTMWWVMVEGRQGSLTGLSLADTTRILKNLGATWALNLDGGGSSGLILNGKRMNARPFNEPMERKVANCLAVVRSNQ
ncbi:MAG: hypothetical protein RIR26_1482 [Pseudomonadota bacterium]|jgi:exopolysaccharide biosynthesis protein